MKSARRVLLLSAMLAVTMSSFPLAAQTPHRLAQAKTQADAAPTRGTVRSLRIVTLSTMVTDLKGIGEWGYAALVEADGHRVLFDTGGRPDTVLHNAEELGIDLTGIRDVVLSHNHWDHTRGLLTLRRELSGTAHISLSRAHVGKGIFLERAPGAGGSLGFTARMAQLRSDYEATGGEIIVHDGPHELFPGVWITGPVPRVHPEKNWNPNVRLKTEDGLVADYIPEDQSLVIDTVDGLVVLAGCGHAGIINTMEYARTEVRQSPVIAAIGGFHLLRANDENLKWTAAKMSEFGVRDFVGAHCTGINPVSILRHHMGLHRSNAVVGAVGSSFELGPGIQPGLLAR